MRQFHSFRLDTTNQCLWNGDVRVTLTPKAFGMLRYLVEHAGRLVTADEILQALWPATYINPEGIRKYILEIRRALGDPPDTPQFIVTLPKRGYQFVASVTDESIAAALPAKETRKIVGRESALAELAGYLSRAQGSERQIVFVTGELGIGKTALVDEFQRRTAAKFPGILMARGQCVEAYGSKEAYYPMFEALSELCHGPEGDSVVQILATQAPTWLIQFPAFVKPRQREMLQREILGATRERTVREISEALETIASETPLLLVFADLHWVDQSTLDLISALARRRQPTKLMLISGYRPVDVALSGHSLTAIKQDLLIHHLCREIALQPLEQADVAAYLAAESGGTAPPKGLARLIYHYCEGNPLVMVTVLEHMREQGLLAQKDGGFTLTVPLEEIELDVPESLRQMIEIRIQQLSEEERRTLEVASVSGISFSAAISAPAANMDVEKFEELCEELSRHSHMVRAAGTQTLADGSISQIFEFAHALYREVFYRRQIQGRRVNLHRRIAELTETKCAQPNEVAPLLAHHFEQGADWRRAIHYLRSAAETAARRFAPEEAAVILQHALGLLSKLPETEREPIETRILDQLATMYFASSDLRAVETYEALSGRASYYGLIDVEARALIDLAYPYSRAEVRHYVEILDRSLQLTKQQKDPVMRARMRASCFLLRIWALGWDPVDAEECRQALAEIRQSGDLVVLGVHLIDYSLLQVVSSRYREALRSITESLEVLNTGSNRNPYFAFAYRNSQFIKSWCLLFLGDWGAALKEVEAAISMMNRNGDYYREYALRLYGAWVHLYAMDFDGVLSLCDSTATSTGDSRGIHPVRFSLMKGCAELGLGNYNRAREHLLAARDDMHARRIMFDWHLRLPLEWGLADLWLSMGDLAQARNEAERFLETASATPERTWQARAWEVNARVAVAETDLTRAQDCIAKALSAMEGFEVPLAAWRVHATAFEIYQSLGDCDLAEQHLELSRETIMKLANSLPPEEPLRQKFLSAPMIRCILDNPGTAVQRAKLA